MKSLRKEPPCHPGPYIRQSVLPEELSVKDVAEMLGVGRPALSNLLNGNAALSPAMAMRIEKAFQTDASTLLGMQARHDEFLARAREDDIAVRAYVPAYLQITALQITAWADSVDARAQLAALLRTLVHSTGANLAAVDFPAFDNSQRKGWDGRVTSGSVTPWIPRGQSGWEFGCSENPRTKAEADYLARTRRVPTKERKSMTFVFVTPRNWQGKNSWVSEKVAQGEWKDVRAFDASDLEQWLEQSVPAQTRMREFLGPPAQDVATLDQIWQEWAKVTEPELPKKLFAPAVERHREKIEKWLSATPGEPFVVTAESILEALAFLNCALSRAGESCPGTHERAVVIRSLAAFRNIAGISSNFVAIVASPEVEKALAGLHKKTHTIIVRGRNAVTCNANIALELLGHEPFREALRDTGLDDARVDQLARESARSPTVLRRRLAQVEGVKSPDWINDNKVARSIMPFMLAGAWDSSVEADREILRCLTSASDEDAERTVAQLQTVDEAPVWSIGHLRGVTSKIDALNATHRVLTKRQLEDFLVAAEIVLSEVDPALELPEDKRWAAELYGKSRDHSSALREGLCDTLVLLAVHGNALVGDRLGIDLAARVSDVVHRLLHPSAATTWLSQQSDLPQYAEAAPDTFLDIIEADLNSEVPQIAELFTPAGAGILGDCPRTGLLWALQLLAWKPGRLVRVISILARLCKWKVDDNWGNTSIGVLETIFCFWIPQTAASLSERKRALETLASKFPQVGWQICIGQINRGSTIMLPGSRPRWRTDAHDAGEVTTVDEARNGRLHAIKLALDWPTHDEHTLGDLVERLGALSPGQRKRVWKLVSAWSDTGPSDVRKAALRERIRRWTLTRRSRHHELDDLARRHARQACARLEPRDPATRHLWLFLNHWVDESVDGLEDEGLGYQQSLERISCQRHDALQEVWAEKGLDGIMELCRWSNASSVVGWHMAKICTDVREAAGFVQNVIDWKSDEQLEKREQCISGFLASFDMPERDAVLVELLARLASSEDASVRLLCCAPFDGGTWQHVDWQSKRVKQRYWEEVVPRWGRHDASETATFVDELLQVDRPRAAFHGAHIGWQHVDSPRLIRLLTEVGTSGAEPVDHFRIEGHYVSTALEALEQRGDTSRDDLARLEFLFINALEHSEHGLRNLEEQLAESPALFMHALALCFRRKDGGEDPIEWRTPNPDNREAIANAAYALLARASRIPGTRPDGSIDLEKLLEWLEQVRTLAREHGRADIGDQMIGQLLSGCPSGTDGIWPCEAVREAIDGLGSQHIATGMIVGKLNARGATLRVAGETPELQLAEQYRNCARQVAFEHPFTARMLEQIGASYDREAQLWDNQDRVDQQIGH
ncbi:MAG: HigA family addiction module antitoxin [Boseongicola sp.]|nr:HigA family addiction module antitoxin [Boseongicola sp.]